MTDPQRLLDGAGDEIEVALLRSAKPDGPSRRSMRRTLAALGIAGAATAAGFATASTAPSAAGGAVIAAGKNTGLLLVKWLGVAALGGLALWGAIDQLGADEPALVQRAVAQEARTMSGAASQALADRRLVSAPKFDRVTATTAPEQHQSEAQSSRLSARESGNVSGGDLNAEVAALDAARKRLDKDPQAALAAMEAYDDKFKKDGVLGQEADVMRIDALARAGQSDRARALGNAFLARHPSSPLAQRVRSILAQLKDD